MKTPIELAKEHGADYEFYYADDAVPSSKIELITLTKEQLDAYNRALVAPYFEALKKYTEWEKHYGPKLGPAGKALAAHREMFGGE